MSEPYAGSFNINSIYVGLEQKEERRLRVAIAALLSVMRFHGVFSPYDKSALREFLLEKSNNL